MSSPILCVVRARPLFLAVWLCAMLLGSAPLAAGLPGPPPVVAAPAAPDGATPAPLAPVVHGHWEFAPARAAGFGSGFNATALVSLDIRQLGGAHGGTGPVSERRIEITLCDPDTATTQRRWVRSLAGTINRFGELHACGGMRTVIDDPPGREPVMLRTMLFGMYRGGELKLNLYSEAVTPVGTRVMKTWNRFLAFTKAADPAAGSTAAAASTGMR